MSTRETISALIWLAGTLAALSISALGVLAAQDGKLHAFALVPLIWSVAFGAGFVHQLNETGIVERLWSRSADGIARAVSITRLESAR
jgi:hypothetical protein